MSLETATTISELDPANPPSGDNVSQGDDHIRMLKAVLQAVFPSASKPFRFPTVVAKTGAYTVLTSDDNTLIEASASGGAFTITLPALLAANKGFAVGVVKTDATANLVTVDGDSADTINDALTDTLGQQFEMVWYTWSGTEWYTDRNNNRQITFKGGSATLTAAESGVVIVDTTAGSVTLTLPAAATSKGRFFYVKKIVAGNSLILDGNAAETIDGAATLTITRRYDAALIVCDGDEWHLIGLYVNQPATLADAQSFAALQTFAAGLLVTNGPTSATPVALTDAASTAWNLDSGTDFTLTATGAVGNTRALAAPTGGTVGQRGYLTFIQDATGGRSLTFDAAYKSGGSLVTPPIVQTNGQRTRYKYYVRAAGEVELTLDWYSNTADNGPFGSQLLHVRDEKAAGVDGGTFTSGAWRTRTLNTSKTNEIVGASLAANQITLPAGTYYIQASAPAHRTSQHIAKLANITDTTDIIIGTVEYIDNGAGENAVSRSWVIGRFTLAAAKVVELQHRCTSTFSTSGFGLATSGFGVVEVFAEVSIWKVK